MSRLKRHSDRKSGSLAEGMTGLEKVNSQETIESFTLSHVSDSSRSSFTGDTAQRDVVSSSPGKETLVRRRSMDDPDMEAIFPGVDFGALFRLRGGISSQHNLWIDMWQRPAPGKTVVPLDEQYLSCLTSFKNLRCLRVSGMLKSYQKKLFQAIWKMQFLVDLQLRMAEEPRISPEAGRRFRPIEKGWSPQTKDIQTHVSPGDRKGRILKEYGDAEYLDNFVIELAKPNLNPIHPEFDTWQFRLLSIVHLTLRGFVVDAVPFCSCFDPEKLHSITFTDCYDAGFYLPKDMEHVTLRIDPGNKHIATEGRRVSSSQEVKRLTLKEGKKVDESAFVSSADEKTMKSKTEQLHGYTMQETASSIPRYTASPSSLNASSGQGSRKPRFSLGFRKRVVSSVIEEDEGEE